MPKRGPGRLAQKGDASTTTRLWPSFNGPARRTTGVNTSTQLSTTCASDALAASARRTFGRLGVADALTDEHQCASDLLDRKVVVTCRVGTLVGASDCSQWSQVAPSPSTIPASGPEKLCGAT